MTDNVPEIALTISKGLEGVIAGNSYISKVDGSACHLIYRGYSIDELIGNATYEEVSYLLLSGNLPTDSELTAWTNQLKANRSLDAQFITHLKNFPPQAGPMALLRTAVSVIGLYDPKETDDSIDAIRAKAASIIAKIPTIVAVIGRLRNNQQLVNPNPELGHSANFLYMLHDKSPSETHIKALDTYLILLADHGFNASTFTARTITGTKSDYYSAITGAIGSLKGPLHGAANRKAMEMLLEIGSVDNIDAYVKQTLSQHKRFMGFGHRVYKGEDPRGRHLRQFSKNLSESSNEPQWFEISEKLQKAVWDAKQLYINVDFYSASLLYYLGIPTDLFTTMFATSRIAGWSAHVIEQVSDNRLIRPLAHYAGPRDLRFVPIDQRTKAATT